jgi:hypothetical protein
MDFEMTPANGDEQDALEVLAPPNSIIIADKELPGAPLKQRLHEEKDVNLQTPLRKNMHTALHNKLFESLEEIEESI